MKGLIAAYVLDGEGGGARIEREAAERWTPERGMLWVHMDYAEAEASTYLEHHAGLSPLVREALLAHDPRPRSLRQGDGMLLVIRGINDHAQANPEDMISLRLWMEKDRVISLRHRKVKSVEQVWKRLDAGEGPRRSADLLHELYDLTLADIATLVDRLDAEVDAIEDEVIEEQETDDVRRRLALVRRQFITLRRHVNPQRITLAGLPNQELSWFNDIDRLNFGEAAEKQSRIIEELDSARERAMVTHEELEGRLSQLMDRRLYVLSLIAAISLPLGILTGLLGVNVGGVPLKENPYGFVLTCGFLVLLSLGLLYLFRKLKWL